MITITQKQAGGRWEALTPQLREALFSDVNADFIWDLCQNEHIPGEKSYQVAEYAGYVLFGFVHSTDLADELTKSVGLPAPLSKTISEKIDARIFAPLRVDIDKIYAPLSKSEKEAATAVLAPKLMQNATSTKPTVFSQPSVVSDVGWSKRPTAPAVPIAPTIKPDALQVSWIVPPSTVKPVSADAAAAAQAGAEPAPVMLHQDATYKAPEKNAGFTLTRPGSGAEVNMSQTPSAAPSRPAVLEFGGAPASTNKPPAPSPAAVHYTAFAEGPRNVSQVAPSVPPSPPAPPTPPMGPKPPTPPAPPQAPQPPQPPKQGNPIVRDFL
jgi:hypothetical protein